MEWSKEKTLKLIAFLQVNPSLWNPSLCDTRRFKHKRKDELRAIAEILEISVADATKKIQHLRTQYNRESAKEARANAEDPNDRYVSNWYAFEYLHFMKDSNKPYRVIQSDQQAELSRAAIQEVDISMVDCKLSNLSHPSKGSGIDPLQPVKPEIASPTSPRKNRDEFSVFGEYIANELRSLKGEKNLLVAKKKIQDAIFEVKMGMIAELPEQLCRVYTHVPANNNSSLHNKVYSASALTNSTHVESLASSHTPPTSQINEIVINSNCHYSNFKVDAQ
ncbi:unnamed protein product [Plutella xylostella]|uniref:(diamondback moth) hypothetical protein n=1 Tax=Plutella xylostella TaxID=51655 RepID=A0A8S4D7C4_PLUXY|nr:unnamed protein product [Plutella xylostella]